MCLEYQEKFSSLPKIVRDCLCIYCGDLPSDRDHLLPKNWTGVALRKHVPTVPACRSCNGILSEFPSPIIASRTEHLHDFLSRRWARRLQNNPSLDGLTGNLRIQIAANNFERNVLRGHLVVPNNGGVPKLPSDLQAQLVTSGPASLVSDVSNIREAKERATNRIQHQRAASKRPLARVHAASNIGAGTPGAAYMTRKNSSVG